MINTLKHNISVSAADRQLAQLMGAAFADLAREKGWTPEQAVAWLSITENYERLIDTVIATIKK